jgi:hypothetical protein
VSTDPRRDVMVLDEISRSLQEAKKITLNQSALKREDCIRDLGPAKGFKVGEA